MVHFGQEHLQRSHIGSVLVVSLRSLVPGASVEHHILVGLRVLDDLDYCRRRPLEVFPYAAGSHRTVRRDRRASVTNVVDVSVRLALGLYPVLDVV